MAMVVGMTVREAVEVPDKSGYFRPAAEFCTWTTGRQSCGQGNTPNPNLT
jgi:hypothetical protein